ncbi:MAG TPA: hypothetical protein VJX30_15895 [Terriglobales bacterium]|jgi:hypothetical protein|nr:hypothetical protein [Terriglobales bacterium]
MTETVKVNCERSIREFIERVRGLHDALLHEAVLLHPGHVDEAQQMWGDADLPSARLIFQSQLDDVLALQVNLKRVSRFEFDPQRELELEGEMTRKGEVALYLTGRDSSDFCEIRAAEVEYKMLGREFLGSGYKLVRQGNDAE